MSRLAVACALTGAACGLLYSLAPLGRGWRLACIALGWLCIALALCAWLTGGAS